MTAHAAEFFTLDEVNRLKIIQDVVDRRLTTQMAALRLGISYRQCRRLLLRYRESGPLGLTLAVSQAIVNMNPIENSLSHFYKYAVARKIDSGS
ncbi:hypothetical protein AZ021_004499 [Enterobacter ludwigii]|nr:hypothetical protein AZ021_004499 [Enterobacter ludwigii]